MRFSILAFGRVVLAVVAAVAVTIMVCTVGAAEPQRLPAAVRPGELGQWVNPFIGTGGLAWVCGMDFPGATLPFGMVRLSPDTASGPGNRKPSNTSGYYWKDNRILGFSHTRLVGTGATDGGNFRVIPALASQTTDARTKKWVARFSHDAEVAFPGYYAVELPEVGVRCELTATTRVGVHRYTFRKDEPPHVLIDISSALGGKCREAELRIRPEANEIEGSVRTPGSFANRYGGLKTYFVARFSRPFANSAVWNGDRFLTGEATAAGDSIGADFGFADHQQPVVLQVALSYVSVQNARENLKEAQGKSFEEVYAEARNAWEQQLGVVRLEGGTEAQKKIFYTALYHSFNMPTEFNDVNGDYLGFDKKAHKAEGFRYYTDMSLWDTFRTVHPLYVLVAPRQQRDMLVSLVQMVKQGGYLPRWPSGGGYTHSMFGTPGDIMVADSYLKGIRDFDVETAYQAMRKMALAPVPKGAAFPGRDGVQNYVKYGYVPTDLNNHAVAQTLEYCYADHAISLLAKALGHDEDAALFAKHAQFYRHLWNPQTQYFQPKDSKGVFSTAFQPLLLTYLDFGGKFTKDYVEGSALQWRWAVPFDAQGLIGLFKSREYFVQELNSFFALSSPERAAWNPGPYYWHGNEPDLYAAYLFNDAGRPDLTQKLARWVLENKYGTGSDGLDGNDDAGTLSAWYVLSALGIYPTAGSDVYQLGAPLFRTAEVKLGDHVLKIVADNYAADHIYVAKVWLNDKPLDRTWLKHAEIASGGTLRFAMAKEPPPR